MMISFTAGGKKPSAQYPLPIHDFDALVALGLVTGWSKVNKFGLARDGVQKTPTDIWDRANSIATQQIWLCPTAPRIHTLVSTSIQDDGIPEGAGTGAQVVRVWYLPDWSTKGVFEDVVMNGTAGVAMQNAAAVIYRMKVIELNTTYQAAAGIITATAAVDATVTAQINVGNNQTEMAIFAIPSGQTLLLSRYEIDSHDSQNPSQAAECDFQLLVNERPDLNTLVWLNKSNKGTRTDGSSSVSREFKPYMTIPGPAIVKMQATASAVDIEGSSEFDGYIVDN